MDDYLRRSHVPAFGGWDSNHDLPFTQCFESARQAGFRHYNYQEDRDLYVTGDLYENDVVTPAMIIVPRRRVKTAHPRNKSAKKDTWVVCDYQCNDVKEPPSPLPPSPPKLRRAPKAVDEDLYKISPELLRAKPKTKILGLFSSCCLQPNCVR